MTGAGNITSEWHDSTMTPEELAVGVVSLLQTYKKTVATAESCTGGLVAAALTEVPGSSRVIGTGVVAYSWECKQRLLDVERTVLEEHGAVSDLVACQMAQGVRRRSGADLGVAVTGEAGPVAGEQQPVGTVYIALADSRRTWVKELHLDGDRAAIRRLAAAHVLTLLMEYLEAYPTVMAGGLRHRQLTQQTVIEKAGKSGEHAWLQLVFPNRSDSPRRLFVKITAWVLLAAVLACSLWLGYLYLVAPDANRNLQASLGELYWGDAGSASAVEAGGGDYPEDMMATFRGLYDRNPDIAGWLRIPGTAVDYPVMTYGDGLYENHSFDGQYSLYGQPYLSEETPLEKTGESRVTIIYGRNTGNGQMFSSLMDYRRIAYLRENTIIQFNSLYAAANYEIFAVMVADQDRLADWDYTCSEFNSDEDYEAFIRSLQAHSLYRTDGIITAQDSLLLLSADAQQEYGFGGARLVIAARLLTHRDSVTAYHINSQVIMPAALNPVQIPRPVTTAFSSGMQGNAVTLSTDRHTTPPMATKSTAGHVNATALDGSTTAGATSGEASANHVGGQSTTEADRSNVTANEKTSVVTHTTGKGVTSATGDSGQDGMGTKVTRHTSTKAPDTRTAAGEMTQATRPNHVTETPGGTTAFAESTTRTNTKQTEIDVHADTGN